jgi:hypothetical protein
MIFNPCIQQLLRFVIIDRRLPRPSASQWRHAVRTTQYASQIVAAASRRPLNWRFSIYYWLLLHALYGRSKGCRIIEIFWEFNEISPLFWIAGRRMYKKKTEHRIQKTEDRRQNGKDIIIYDWLITIAYFSLASVPLWLWPYLKKQTQF